VSGRLAAILPVLDEAAAIGTVLAAVPPGWVDEVIVVDGGSRDETVAIARANGATVIEERQRGYGRACASGAAAAIAGGAGILVFLDGDGGDRPQAIPALVAPIKSGACDFVIGSRSRGEREKGSIGLHQLVAGRLVGFLIGCAYGVFYTDMCAFRAIRADAFLRLGMRETTHGWNLEMQMRAARKGLRIREVPVPAGRRLGGRSKVAGTLSGSLEAGFRIVTTYWRVLREPR
jgi:glycosyltransferase involved in cell wall biosynthesis